MKILLVNSNRYRHPPVIPLGLEYLAGAIINSKHEYSIIDLCFSDKPLSDLDKKIDSYNPDIIGITFRQIDTVLFHTNEYFIDDLSEIVSLCRRKGRSVILGGAGFSIAPKKILEITKADFGIHGPGEIAMIGLLDDLEKNIVPKPIIDGYDDSPVKDFPCSRERIINYDRYQENEGTVGFRTQIGCNEKCIYCPEQNKKVIHINPEITAMELKGLKDEGCNRFHLCDSEFNLNLDHSISVCRKLTENVKGISWSVYMKPFPFSEELFTTLRESGANLITLSLDTVPQKYSTHDYKKLEQFFALSMDNNIKIAIDLMTGFPDEKIEEAEKFINFLSSQPAETVGVNNSFRVYPNTPLCSLIKKESRLHEFLVGYRENADFMKPVFFRSFPDNEILSMIHEYNNFRLEGPEKATNYQRVK